MNGPQRTVRGVVVALIALVLTACAGLPMSGPVNAGRVASDDDTPPQVSFVPAGPAPDATAEQIVDGFIAAGSGTRGNWQIAQEFLTAGFRDQWRPQAGVTVYRSGAKTVIATSDTEVTVDVIPEATVDATGAYTVAGDGDIPFTFQLAQVNGQWRIAQAPDGVILDAARFASVFRNYTLQYFDPTWSRLVPEVRWFPIENAATSIAGALVDGAPSPWLADSVATAFTPGSGLASRSVPIRAGVAEVSFRPEIRSLDQIVLDRMQTQLEESLAGAGITSVDMLVEDEVVTAAAVPLERATVDARPLVLTEDAFGFLSGAQIEPVAGLSEALLAADATTIDVDASRAVAAVRTDAGVVRRVGADGTVVDVDTRTGLVGPTIDPDGYVWTVPRDDPSAVRATASDGTVHEIVGAWPAAASITAMRVSRDGTRIAALVRDGATPELWVAGIVRDADGVPQELGERIIVADLPGEGADVLWLDGARLAVAGDAPEQGFFAASPVGGPTGIVRAPTGATTLGGGGPSGTVRLRDAQAHLYVQRGASWQLQAPGILALATQQGQSR